MFWNDLWGIVGWFFWIFVFVAYLMALFSIIGDLFRDTKTNGWVKAIWIVFLVFVPFLTALVYLIARGSGMAERSAEAAAQQKQATEEHVRGVVGSTGPVEEISKAHQLLQSGAITDDEFAAIKRKSLG